MSNEKINAFENEAKEILSKHGCKFVRMISECRVCWKNKNGCSYTDDIAVLRMMTEEAWNFWSNN